MHKALEYTLQVCSGFSTHNKVNTSYIGSVNNFQRYFTNTVNNIPVSTVILMYSKNHLITTYL